MTTPIGLGDSSGRVASQDFAPIWKNGGSSTLPCTIPTALPENAELGGERRPSIRLTEWEIQLLESKLNIKYICTVPDWLLQAMLKDDRRGRSNYVKARSAAQKNGTRFIDMDKS